MAIRILSFLFCMSLCEQTCGNKLSVLKYKNIDSCKNSLDSALIEIPIVLEHPLNEFTFCGNYRFKFMRDSVLLFMKDQETVFYMFFDLSLNSINQGAIIVDGVWYLFPHNQTIIPDNWQHVCFAKSLNWWKVVLNGELIFNKSIGKDDPFRSNILGTTLYLGGVPPPKWIKRRFEGSIMDVYFWNQSLDVNQLKNITSNGKSGKFISSQSLQFSWDTFKLSKSTSCIEHQTIDKNDELFEASFTKKVLIFEEKSTFDSAKNLCEGFGGKLFLPQNDHDLSKFATNIQNSVKCKWAYMAFKKNDENVVDLNGTVASYASWKKGEPNGKHENCVAANTIPTFSDVPCSRKKCFACLLAPKNIFTIRGKIPMNVPRSYFVHMTGNTTEIRGIENTEYIWNTTWKLGPNLKQDLPSNNMPPVGLKHWNGGMKLKLSQCNGQMFTSHIWKLYINE